MILSDIKKQAREALSSKWKNAVLITLLYFAFEFILGFIIRFVENIPIFNFIISIGIYVISIPIAYGLIISFMKLKRGEDVKCYDFFNFGFSNFSRSWKLAGNMLKKLWLPILLCIFGMIALSFAIFSVGYVVSLDSDYYNLFIIANIIGIPLFIATFIYLYSCILSYSLTYMIAYDNESMEAKDVVEESKKLIVGNRVKYVLLQLSFIGWVILVPFTLYIGIFWLIPYIQVTMICFYEALKENKTEE